MNVSLASPFWQGCLFFGAFLFLLWELWNGWRRGIVRSAANCDRAQLASFYVGQARRTRISNHLNFAGKRRDQQRACATVRHLHDIDSGF